MSSSTVAGTRRVAVLGAGIMGCSTALFLARKGIQVTLYDEAAAPFSGASRWNEGKIHLGYLYANDPSYRTAKQILPGGLAFPTLLKELIQLPVTEVSEAEDVYLVHRNSVMSVESTQRYFEGLSDIVRQSAGAGSYFTDLTTARMRRLSTAELGHISCPECVLAGFAVPEKSVLTSWVADRFIDAVNAERRIALRMGHRVISGEILEHEKNGSVRIESQMGESETYDAAVNALWEGRPLVDSSVGIQQQYKWSHRFRVSLFVKTRTRLDIPPAVVCTGPFGDVKNYNGKAFYLSWYTDGLLASGEKLAPPEKPNPGLQQRRDIIAGVFRHLGQCIPPIQQIQDEAEEIVVDGGWVFASGSGKLSDPASTLHQRDRIGITRKGRWYSVDTGKYSIAPWLARELAQHIVDEIKR